MVIRTLTTMFLGLALALPAAAADDPLLTAMEAELARTMEGLANQDEPPYFLAYEVIESHVVEMHGEDGAFGSQSEGRTRHFDVDVRVGDPSLDNTHPDSAVEDGPGGRRRADYTLPLDDDPRALRQALWQETERRYRGAISRLVQLRTSQVTRVDEDDLPDFSPAEATEWLGEPAVLELDRDLWVQRLRDASAAFRDSKVVYDGSVRLSVRAETRYFVSSEGARLRIPRTHARITVSAATLAPEGTELALTQTWDEAKPAELPDVATMLASAHELEEMLVALSGAPAAEPLAGPAILSGRAAAVFFHEIFGHRMEGTRLRDDEEGQTFADVVDQSVLPPFLGVVDDPTLARLDGTYLNGHYPFDNEGVAAERVTLVEDGILRRFLGTRTPIPGQDQSNGHGRRQSGNDPMSRQGNLLVLAAKTVTYDQLRERLRDEVEAQGAPYGLLFDDITGGFTYTGRSMANAFNVSPVIVYRVYADGRPDELVRGVDLIGTPLATFSEVLAASDQTSVFNGYCGAESGWVPVSAASPDLLVRRIEVQRKDTGDERPPLLDPPLAEGGER